MNILVIESNGKLSTEVVDCLNEIFNDPAVNIITAGDLTSGIGVMQPSAGKSPIDLVICAETVLEGFDGPQQVSNGVAFMQECHRRGQSTPMIILTEERPEEKLVGDMYMVHRHTRVLEARLHLAVKHFFPHLAT